MVVENRLNLHSEAFEEILYEETILRREKDRVPVGSAAWNAVWNKLDRILERKRKYEAAVERSRNRRSFA